MSLYEEYGKLMVQAEILQGRIIELKKAIQADMNKPKEEPKED